MPGRDNGLPQTMPHLSLKSNKETVLMLMRIHIIYELKETSRHKPNF